MKPNNANLGLLIAFLQQWRDWTKAGAEEGVFLRDHGLCFNFTEWAREDGIDKTEISATSHLFWEKLGREHTPFSSKIALDPHESYAIECKHRNFHLNPARLAWVDKFLKEHE